jgi:hypothetical protein
MDFSQLSNLVSNFGSGTSAPQEYTPDSEQYVRGTLLPFKKNIKTKEVSFGVPTVAQDIGRAITAPYRAMRGEFDVNSPLAIQEAMNLGLNTLGGGFAGSAIRPAPAGSLGMFVGKNAKYYDQSLERLASEMHAKGSSPEEIWKTTGVRRWHSGARQEIPDNTASYNIKGFDDPNLNHYLKTKDGYRFVSYDEAKDLYTKGLGKQLTSQITLNKLIDHPELFKNYPQLEKTRVTIDPNFKRGNAQFNPTTDTITISDEDFWHSDLSPLLHEIQHNVQKIEGWQSGGSPEQFDVWDTLIPHWNPYTKKPQIYNEFEQYQRLPGEIEARMTEQRQHMTALERLMYHPSSKDVGMKEMTIHFKNHGRKK